MVLLVLFYLSLILIKHVSSNHMTPLTFPCEQWGKEYPLENNVTEKCSMEVKVQDQEQFLFHLKNSNFAWVLFRIYLTFDVKEILKTKCAIEPYHWTWTFPAPHGAYEFLKWPKEYGIWSMGLLDMYSYGPLNISMKVYGSCPVIIGQKETTQRIGMALLSMTNRAVDIPNAYEDFRYGTVCYNERLYIGNYNWYFLCLHINCPIEATGYKCCTSENYGNKTRVVCNGEPIYFDNAWWIIPFIIGLLMFSYSPFLLVKVFHHSAYSNKDVDTSDNMTSTRNTEKWLVCNPLSLFTIIKANLQINSEKHHLMTIILRRIAITLSTLVIIFIQICVHYVYDYHYTLELVKHGVPLAFRSMAVGYTHSKKNFMPTIGGPYVGLGIYLATTILLVTIPRDFEKFLNKGIPNNLKLSTSPLTIDIRTKARLGSVYNIERQSGYDRLYNLMKAHIYMLLNPSFWSLAIQMQVRRFVWLIKRLTKNTVLLVILVIVLFVPYILIVCTIELILSIIYYGFPIVLFFQVTVLAYYKGIRSCFDRFGKPGKITQHICTLITILFIVFNMYILSIVFVDSCHFITRMLIFTFTGFIAFPSSTYGYFVFIITILMYITESVHHIRSTYSKLFKYVSRNCDTIRRTNMFPDVHVSKMEDDVPMISRDLFIYVVSRHKPIRIEIFFSVLKLVFITFLLYIASHTIVTLQRVWDLNPLTQVVTALFVCLVPKLWRMLQVGDEYLDAMRENMIFQKLVIDYCRQNLSEVELNATSDATEEGVD